MHSDLRKTIRELILEKKKKNRKRNPGPTVGYVNKKDEIWDGTVWRPAEEEEIHYWRKGGGKKAWNKQRKLEAEERRKEQLRKEREEQEAKEKEEREKAKIEGPRQRRMKATPGPTKDFKSRDVTSTGKRKNLSKNRRVDKSEAFGVKNWKGAAKRGGQFTELLFRKVMNISVGDYIGDGSTKGGDNTDMKVLIAPSVTIHPDYEKITIDRIESDIVKTWGGDIKDPTKPRKGNLRSAGETSHPGMGTWEDVDEYVPEDSDEGWEAQKRGHEPYRGRVKTGKKARKMAMPDSRHNVSYKENWEYAKDFVEGSHAEVEIGTNGKSILIGTIEKDKLESAKTQGIISSGVKASRFGFNPFRYNRNLDSGDLKRALRKNGNIVRYDELLEGWKKKGLLESNDFRDTFQWPSDDIEKTLKDISFYYYVSPTVPKEILSVIWNEYGDDYYCFIDTSGGSYRGYLVRTNGAPVTEAIFWTDTAEEELKRTTFTWASTLDTDQMGKKSKNETKRSKYSLSNYLIENSSILMLEVKNIAQTFISETIPLVDDVIPAEDTMEVGRFGTEGVYLDWSTWDWDKALQLEVYEAARDWADSVGAGA